MCYVQLEDIYDDICKLALEHIHANEVILTFSRSRTIEKFLKVSQSVRQTVSSQSSNHQLHRGIMSM
jgi:translation initiation factor 2B subunit (eIF-2B alpha/beta/delta family)